MKQNPPLFNLRWQWLQMVFRLQTTSQFSVAASDLKLQCERKRYKVQLAWASKSLATMKLSSIGHLCKDNICSRKLNCKATPGLYDY